MSEDPSDKQHPKYHKVDSSHGRPSIFQCDRAFIRCPLQSAKACLKMTLYINALDSWEMHGCLLQTQTCFVAHFHILANCVPTLKFFSQICITFHTEFTQKPVRFPMSSSEGSALSLLIKSIFSDSRSDKISLSLEPCR